MSCWEIAARAGESYARGLHLVNCWCCYSLSRSVGLTLAVPRPVKLPPTSRHNPICACCGCRGSDGKP